MRPMLNSHGMVWESMRPLLNSHGMVWESMRPMLNRYGMGEYEAHVGHQTERFGHRVVQNRFGLV